MAGVGIDRRDHPVGGHLPGDAPPPIGAIGALHGLHVLPGDQRQQRHRLGGLRAEVLIGQVAEQPVRVADQLVDQPITGLPGSS